MGVGCTEEIENLAPVLLEAPAGALNRTVKGPLKEPPPAFQGASVEPEAILLLPVLEPSNRSSELAASRANCVL